MYPDARKGVSERDLIGALSASVLHAPLKALRGFLDCPPDRASNHGEGRRAGTFREQNVARAGKLSGVNAHRTLASPRAEAPSATVPRPRGLERWLRSPVRLAALGLGFVALATAMNTFGNIEARLARGAEVPVVDILLGEGLNWFLSAALATPLGVAAVGLGRRFGALRVGLGLVLASGVVAGLLVLQQVATRRWFSDFERPERFERFERTERAERPDRAARGEGAERPPSTPQENDPARARRGAQAGETAPTTAVPPGGPGVGAPAGANPDRPPTRGQRFGGRGFGGPMTFAESLRFAVRYRAPRIVLATWAFIGLGAAIRLFLDGRTREREAQRLALHAQALEGQLAGAQLDALRAQLHPHFLFNALHSIGALVRSGRGDEAVQTLDQLGGLLRLALDAHGDGFVTLEEELAVLARYVDVERVRLGARLAFELDVDAVCRAADVPLFLLQPLVENAVRCAVAERSEGGRVRVRARAVDTELVLDVDDDGPGFPAKVLAGEGWGIGLTNVAGRLRTLFEGAARIELGASDLGGARVRLVLPRDDEGGALQ